MDPRPMPIPRRWSSHSQATGDWRMDPEGQWVIWADVSEVVEWADRLRAIEDAARTFFEDEHECLHEPDPPCGLELLRAALSERGTP